MIGMCLFTCCTVASLCIYLFDMEGTNTRWETTSIYPTTMVYAVCPLEGNVKREVMVAKLTAATAGWYRE